MSADLLHAVASAGAAVPAELAAAMAAEATGGPAASYPLLNALLALPALPAPSAQALAQAQAGPPTAVVRAALLLRTQDGPALIDWHRGRPPHENDLATLLADRSGHPEHLRFLCAHETLGVAVAAARNPSCPDQGLALLLERLLTPQEQTGQPSGKALAHLRNVLARRGRAAVRELCRRTSDPNLLQVAEFLSEPVEPADAEHLLEHWVLPAVRALAGVTGQRREWSGLARITELLCPSATPQSLRELSAAWGAVEEAGAVQQRVLLERLRRGEAVGDFPVAVVLAGSGKAVPLVEAFIAAAGHACQEPGQWRTLLRLADGFPGTVGELLAVTCAVTTPAVGPVAASGSVVAG